MIRKITLSLLACLGISFASVAQSQPYPVCGSAEMHKSLMQTDPSFANIVNDMNIRATALMNNPSALVTTNSNGQKVWEIPVYQFFQLRAFGLRIFGFSQALGFSARLLFYITHYERKRKLIQRDKDKRCGKKFYQPF